MRTLLLIFAAAFDAPDWSRDIQPLFAQHCSGCHAASVTMGSLNLETHEGVLKGGNHGTIIVRGRPRESRLYTMLTGETSPSMPMDGKALAPAQVAMVGNWIAAGAAGPAKAQSFSLAWSPDGARAAVGGYKRVTFSDNSPEWTGMAEAVRAVAYSPSGQLLAAGGVCGRRGEVMIQGGPTITGHADCIYAAAFSPDGKTVATASYDKLIKVWDAATGKEVRTLKDHIDAVYALAFTPDGKRLLSASADRGVKVWNPATGDRLYSMTEATDGLNTLAVSPDGKLVAAGGLDKNIRIWTLGETSGELLASQIAHEDAILRIAFAPDGKSLVSASADRSLKRFSVKDLSELAPVGAQSDWVTGMAYSPDGKRLAVVRIDGTFQIYPEVQPK
jgi:WD40 repeat protein